MKIPTRPVVVGFVADQLRVAAKLTKTRFALLAKFVGTKFPSLRIGIASVWAGWLF
jgi:hypothetical protein